ncbi:MAG: histidinol dehydrogenase [Magnetococcales bacterium]|nr:histidinol dehydrogenase [Magnetococcales bacterium]
MADSLISRLDTTQADFKERFHRLCHWDEGNLVAVEKRVSEIVARIRNQGDGALVDLTRRFDRLELTPETLEFSEAEIDQAISQAPDDELAALELAAKRIRSYHEWQMPPMGVQQYQDESGTTLGQRTTALDRAGLYVPGGLASYPSSVLMNAIPAKVAGVEELIMTVPTPDGVANPLILAAARISGVDRVFRVGGAQAIAAMAYGTATIPSVDKIVGPGNIYVAIAKRQVFGQVGIDMIAGPSEILVIADKENDPAWIAADLLSQAEHDEIAQSVLITDDADFADAVEVALEAHLKVLSRSAISRISLASRGAIILASDLEEACRLASQLAPEHLELALTDPERYLPLIHHAGAIFMGRHTPEAMGDYVAGPNHVLPTSGTARFSSPLGVYDFIKRTSLIHCTPDSLKVIGPAASTLAASEGLTAHKLSVDIRLKGDV